MLGKTIKRLRSARGISKSELARRVGVSPTAVHNWEEYGGAPRGILLPSIASALDTTVASLTGQQGEILGGAAAPSPREAAAVVIECKEKIAQVYGVRPDQVSVSINF